MKKAHCGYRAANVNEAAMALTRTNVQVVGELNDGTDLDAL